MHRHATGHHMRESRMGLEGLVSKHRDRPYRGGHQKHWIKVKNRSHPAMDRVRDAIERRRSPLATSPHFRARAKQ
jgi:hypothetical protein